MPESAIEVSFIMTDFLRRTHHCNALQRKDLGQKVTLMGWVHSFRDHGSLVFIDLRDREGLTQVVCDSNNQELAGVLSSLRSECVIAIQGTVQARPDSTINPKLLTGEIEVAAEAIELLNACDVLPFPMEDALADKVSEELRLKYRYLDLRRPKKLNLLRLRHTAAKAARAHLDGEGFTEVELPVLFKSTPEGAREFLVPSRLNAGEFYALTQSPQQYKQMLMVAGVERYYSFARCFRDEDLRADRQPEFTQIDLEMSFIDREDMYHLIEGLLKRVWKEALNVDIPTPFPRMPYHEAMNRYGVDKPDTRFAIEIADLTEDFRASGFGVFAQAVQGGGVVRAINAKGLLPHLTQGELTRLEDIAKSLGAKGLAYMKIEGDQWKSPIAKFLNDNEKAALIEKLNIEDQDVIFFAAAPWERACAILGRIRLESAWMLQKQGKLSIPADQFNFLWVIDFPLILKDEETNRYVSAHHPFTAPVKEDAHLLTTAPEKVRGQHYDIVLNGTEIGGGSIRIHNPILQKQIFEEVLKIPQDVVQSRFGYMLEAFHFGAPPHGGLAIGFDRLAAILGGQNSIRDVIAFPKTQKGQDLMSQSPGPVTEQQLKDVFIRSTATPS
jgi:aspartyl-tRNA synthetase